MKGNGDGIMKPIASVVGIGALPVGKHLDKLEHEMMAQALVAAIADAGLTKKDIDALTSPLRAPMRTSGTSARSWPDTSRWRWATS